MNRLKSICNHTGCERIFVKVGDLVQLKSGSAPIVVEKVKNGGKKVQCIWVSNGNLLEREFDSKCLELYQSPQERKKYEKM